VENKKNYVGSGKTKSLQFGEVQELSLNIEQLSKLPRSAKGYIRVTVSKRREPDQFGNDLAVVENTYVPKTRPTDANEDALPF
jgi:hypothetical protein